MIITDGYLVELADNSFTGETHVLVTSRYYEEYKEMPQFTSAKEIVKCLDLNSEINNRPYLTVWY